MKFFGDRGIHVSRLQNESMILLLFGINPVGLEAAKKFSQAEAKSADTKQGKFEKAAPKLMNFYPMSHERRHATSACATSCRASRK
jgi:hypothetical protein